MKIQLLILFSLFGNGAFNLSAQTITGKVMDETSQPVAFANVVLLSLPDSAFVQGTITNEQGGFAFDKADASKKLLQISYIGYKPLNKQVSSGELGTLTLQSDAVMLGETVITGHRPAYSLKGNNLTTNVENTLLSSLGTANDVLKRIPGLRASDDGSVEVFGKGTPLIYINGRQVRDFSELAQLNSKDIAKVELITNPGAEYSAEVKAVLKIKTVKPVGEGVGGSLRTALQKGTQWSNNQQLSLNYRKGKVDLFGSLYYDKTKRIHKQEDLQTVHGDTLWKIKDKSKSSLSNDYIQGDAGVNFQFNEKNSIGLRYTGIHNTSKSFIPTHYEVKANGEEYDMMEFTNRMEGKGDTHKANAYYSGLIGNKLDVNVNFDWLYGDSEGAQNVMEQSTYKDDRTVRSLSSTKNNLYAVKLVFSYPIAEGALQFGTEVSFTSRDNRYINEEQILADAYSNIKSNNQAAFASYALPIGKTYLSAGLRYEHASSDYYENDVKSEEQSKTYNNLFPSLSFSFPVKAVQMALGYSARIKRPSYFALRNDIQYASRYTYERGNPALQPEIIHDLSLQAGYKFIQFVGYYNYTENAIMSMAFPYPGNNSITVFGMENVSSCQSFGGSLSVSPKIGFWEPMLTLEAMRQILTGTYLGEVMHFNRPAVALSWNNQLRLPAGLILSADMYYTNSYHSGYIRKKSVVWADCGIRRSFLKDALDVSFQVSDLFASQKDAFLNYGQIMIYDKWNYSDTRQVRLMVAYRFNATRSKYRGTGAANDEMKRL